MGQQTPEPSDKSAPEATDGAGLPADFAAPDRSARLREVIAGLGKDVQVAILTQDNPDPDAIGAALGLQRICNHLRPDLTTRIYHGGHISHPQNLTMVSQLGISLLDIDDFEQLGAGLAGADPTRFVMLVDAANTGSKNIQSTAVPPDAVFDHHKDTPPESTAFVDIRAVGSTCTIIAEHLGHLGVPIGPKLATALFFGLHNDTRQFSCQMSNADWAAMRYLQPKIDPNIFDEIQNYTLPNYLFELEQLAREHKRHKGSLLVSGLGVLPATKRDGIPFVADKLLRSEGVDTVVIHAIVGDRIHASLRSNDERVDANEYIQCIFPARYAGAKDGSGGAQVPIGWLAPGEDLDEGTRNLFIRYVNEFITRRAFSCFPNGSA